ncbi:SLOG family protein [Novosphingobium sp. ES2-1]|uniref:SLOG family protein n=1 Tax=Novosphingobium sp. ES2-1 TaxID=2780074 RepID=UPI001E35CF1E|nr:SLOG family protein [Novosphingobium sp. ES2-1]
MTDRFSNFADLAEHYAREIATPHYARAFMEQTELAKLSIEHEPSAAEMPDPEAAQAAIEMMLATVFDLFRDTRMEDFASEVAWGIANSFHVVAKRLDDREDAMANRLQEKLREYDPSEVYATDLEDLTMQARSLAECRDAMECMRDHAARIYLVETGRPFSPVRGSRVSSKTNASMIEARDYLAAQKAQRREQFAPSGPVVVFSGGQQFTDIALVEDYLDAIHTRVPSMALATTAQNKGADVIAAAWASRHNVPVILCKPDTSRGPSAPYQRNARMLAFKPVEAVVCNIRDAATITPRSEVQPLVLPDDIMKLPSLRGFLVFPEGFDAARIKLTYKDYPKVAEGYVLRVHVEPIEFARDADDDAEGEAGGRENKDEIELFPAPAIDDEPAKPCPAPRQEELNFAAAQAEPTAAPQSSLGRSMIASAEIVKSAANARDDQPENAPKPSRSVNPKSTVQQQSQASRELGEAIDRVAAAGREKEPLREPEIDAPTPDDGMEM